MNKTTPITDKARRMLEPFKHLIDFAGPQVDELLKEIEALENTPEYVITYDELKAEPAKKCDGCSRAITRK